MTLEELKKIIHYDPSTGIFIWRWRPCRVRAGALAGSPDKDGYLRIGINRTRYFAHRLAWFYVYGKWPKRQIDHINGVRIDNRIKNLRDATDKMNKQNLKKATKRSKSGILGAYKYGNKYYSRITINSKQRHLGIYDTAQEAHQVYLTAKRKYHEGCTI